MESEKIILIKLLRNNLKNRGIVIIVKKYSQGKLKFYTSFKERLVFENYLNDSVTTWCSQVIKNVRISAHKFPLKTGQFESKNRIDKIYPLCCEGIGINSIIS